MKPSKLERHLQSKHPDLAKKPLEYFHRMHEGMKKQKSLKNMIVEDKSLLKASYLIALQTAKNKKPSTIGEDLIKPCMLQACEAVLGKQAVQRLKIIPMSANAVKRRITEMANQVIKMVKNSSFYSIQLDEFTDVSNKALLLCFVRVECEGDLQEELFAHSTCQVEQLALRFLQHLIVIFWNTELNGKNVLAYVEMVLQT